MDFCYRGHIRFRIGLQINVLVFGDGEIFYLYNIPGFHTDHIHLDLVYQMGGICPVSHFMKKLLNNARQLEDTADTIRRAARRLYEAEMTALRLAEMRKADL